MNQNNGIDQLISMLESGRLKGLEQLWALFFCMNRFEYINKNNLSFIYVNKKRKNILPSDLKDAIFISVATSYLVSNKQNKKTY